MPRIFGVQAQNELDEAGMHRHNVETYEISR